MIAHRMHGWADVGRTCVPSWLLNQVPLIPIGTAIKGLFSHSAHRAFRKHMGSCSRRESRISNPERSSRVSTGRADATPVEWRRGLCMDRDKLLPLGRTAILTDPRFS